MTQEEFMLTAKEKIEKLINYISQDEYDKIPSIALIADSWCNDNQEDGIITFKEWLEEQLTLWSEEYGKEFLIDAFDKNNLNLSNLENDHSFSEYYPTSHGEELDFWFELDMHIGESDNLILVFNINF